MTKLELDDLLRRALLEDIGHGDITTESCVPIDAQSKAHFIAKEAGVVCGMEVVTQIFALLDSEVLVTPRVTDGTQVKVGDIIAEIQGLSRSILSGERVALNLLQRLSGIATKTAAAVSEVADTKTKICDTRKTTPGLRALEKYAVKTGGGANHRFGLYDGVMVKDNHIIAAGGIQRAVESARANVPHTVKIEVETTNLDEVAQAIAAGADIIMLDNMDCATMKKAVQQIAERAVTEASGNMGDRSLREVAETGVDFISIGALTHTVRALDISLRFIR